MAVTSARAHLVALTRRVQGRVHRKAAGAGGQDAVRLAVSCDGTSKAADARGYAPLSRSAAHAELEVALQKHSSSENKQRRQNERVSIDKLNSKLESMQDLIDQARTRRLALPSCAAAGLTESTCTDLHRVAAARHRRSAASCACRLRRRRPALPRKRAPLPERDAVCLTTVSRNKNDRLPGRSARFACLPAAGTTRLS